MLVLGFVTSTQPTRLAIALQDRRSHWLACLAIAVIAEISAELYKFLLLVSNHLVVQ